MSSARKKAIVRLLSGELHRGYLPASGLAPDGEGELLRPDGRVLALHFSDIKHIAYVRDFNMDDSIDPERIGFRSFPSKPRGQGLWVRAEFHDGDALEGLMHGGLPLLDSLLLDHGLFLEPPENRGNTQRVFIPRTALAGFEVLGVAGRSAASRKVPPQPAGDQVTLFDLGEGAA